MGGSVFPRGLDQRRVAPVKGVKFRNDANGNRSRLQSQRLLSVNLLESAAES